jgi:hypothetical protein
MYLISVWNCSPKASVTFYYFRDFFLSLISLISYYFFLSDGYRRVHLRHMQDLSGGASFSSSSSIIKPEPSTILSFPNIYSETKDANPWQTVLLTQVELLADSSFIHHHHALSPISLAYYLTRLKILWLICHESGDLSLWLGFGRGRRCADVQLSQHGYLVIYRNLS